MLRPIRELNAQARDISEKHLDRRMPVTGERDEFNTLAETLNTVFDRLQHAFLRQKRLLADASHELKTPVDHDAPGPGRHPFGRGRGQARPAG